MSVANPVSQRGRMLAKVGACLQLFIIGGMAMAAVEILSTPIPMDAMASNAPSVAEVTAHIEATSESLGQAYTKGLSWSLIGLIVAFAGLLLFAVAVVGLRYRAPWAFWFSTIYGFFFCFMGMVCIPFGLAIMIHGLVVRREHLAQRFATSPLPVPTVDS